MRLAVLLLCTLLTACGGGGGTSAPPAAPPPPPTPRQAPLEYGYFGIDGAQLAETASHVTFAQALDWGDWNTANYDAFRTSTTITQLQEAKARGIPHAWVGIGYLVFTQAPGCTSGCYTPRADAIPRLLAFRQQLAAVGVLDMVKVLYPVDEPELHGLSDGALTPLLRAIKTAWPDAMLGVIYGDTHSYPGLAAYDLVGKDKYGAGAGVLGELPPIQPPQRHLIVPGGASPWRNAPQPFYDYALAHDSVYAIVPFTWFDRPAGQDSGPGIRSNGMAAAYTAIGCALTKRCG